ncbi:ATP-binding protein [Fodinisporobacter ferrooxydans]|uniref:ATP-binding protein n=1 Tax=Fodinisporobacter ferrooxydans TaxID=2901836 RepID=A0ABY4CDN7_9BACL|nr:ATP-binding protein [Alicyclobacillaceae bacterium MYW30-H2]
MPVYGLVGPSGTGKSHHAANIAMEIGADLIIDDGLLIKNHRVLAGFSAKFESNKMAAIKRAIFTDLSHRQSVKHALSEQQNDSILVLGTSRKMITTICDNLGICDEIKWLPIDEAVSENSIAIANNLRKRGMHAIPIVQTQLTEPLISHFIQKLSRKFFVNTPDIALVQKENLTIVNPLFGSGAIYIHPRVLKDCVAMLLAAGNHPFKLRRIRIDSTNQKTIHVDLHAYWVANLPKHVDTLYKEIYDYLQKNLGFVSPHLNFHVLSIDAPHINTRS